MISGTCGNVSKRCPSSAEFPREKQDWKCMLGVCSVQGLDSNFIYFKCNSTESNSHLSLLLYRHNFLDFFQCKYPRVSGCNLRYILYAHNFKFKLFWLDKDTTAHFYTVNAWISGWFRFPVPVLGTIVQIHSERQLSL